MKSFKQFLNERGRFEATVEIGNEDIADRDLHWFALDDVDDVDDAITNLEENIFDIIEKDRRLYTAKIDKKYPVSYHVWYPKGDDYYDELYFFDLEVTVKGKKFKLSQYSSFKDLDNAVTKAYKQIPDEEFSERTKAGWERYEKAKGKPCPDRPSVATGLFPWLASEEFVDYKFVLIKKA